MGDDEQTRRARARVGSTINGKWRLDALLGVGGMAAVYAATHRNKKRGAVKILHPELSIDEEVRSRFLREGYVANTVGHRGTVQVDDDDVAEDGSAYLVMELLDGETVEARWERAGRRLDVVEVLSITDQLLDTLAAAHAAGVVHRDIKPENLFVTRDGVVKVLDFGIARLRELSNTRSGATRASATMGTPAFMAPEQARSRWDAVDGQTDLWAVGATMFTLLAGRHVHEAETGNEQMALAIMRPAPSLASVAPTIPQPVCALIDRALAYEKAARWPDAATMQLALREAHDAIAGGASVAARLSVPEAVGVPQVVAGSAPTTARGVAASSADTLAGRPPRVAVIVGGAVAALAVVAIIGRTRGTPDSASPTSSPASAASAMAPVSPEGAPEVAPPASVVAPSPEAPPAAAVATTSPAASASSKPPASAPSARPSSPKKANPFNLRH